MSNAATATATQQKKVAPAERFRIERIISHDRFHFDEGEAIFLMQKYGEIMFPGVSTAKVEFMASLPTSWKDKTEYDLMKEGVLLIGIGNGRFDEHPSVKVPEKKGECAATLVAKHLGIDTDPTITELLKYALRIDSTATASPFDLATFMKDFHQSHPDSSATLWEIVRPLIEGKWMKQKLFCACESEAREHGLTDTFSTRKHRNLVIMAAETDNPQFQAYARSKGCAVIMQKKSTGNVQIFTNKKFGLDISLVVARIRNAEREANGRKPISDPDIICANGAVEGAEVWYYHEVAGNFFNGSLTTPKPPTKVSWGTIIKIVSENIRDAH